MITNLQAFKNKLTNKLWGVVHIPATGKKKGDVLLSYMTEPFTKNSNETLSTYHSSYWECREIVRLLSSHGYAIDAINWSDTKFVPTKKYIACIDTQKNLARLAPYLGNDCKKVMHIVASHWKFQNESERTRIEEIRMRREINLTPRRVEAESQNIETADFVEGLGNKSTFDTYAFAGKKIFPIFPSPAVTFENVQSRNISEAKNNFLFLGGGGMALKGLDRAIEALQKMPENKLTVCGPVESEKDFFDAFKKELLETPNIAYKGRIDQGSTQFQKIAMENIAMIYPSASEGCAGAVITSLYAGHIVIASKKCGVDIDLAGGILLENSSIEEIKSAVKRINGMSDDELKNRSEAALNFARANFTREGFSSSYGKFIDKVLNL